MPACVQRYAQTEFYCRLRSAGNGAYGADTVAAAMAAVGDALGQPVETMQQAAE